MKSAKRTVLILICICTVFLLCGCALTINKLLLEIKDKNGEDDYSLAVLTDSDICAEDNICYCFASTLDKSGDKSYTDEDHFHDADNIEATTNTPLSGTAIMQLTYCAYDTVTFTVKCDLRKGNARIVLLDEKLNIIHDFSITEESSYTVNEAKGKKFQVRLAGESAEFTLNISRVFSNE